MTKCLYVSRVALWVGLLLVPISASAQQLEIARAQTVNS